MKLSKPKYNNYFSTFFIPLLSIIYLLTVLHHDEVHVSAEICTACSNETHVMNDPTAKVLWPPQNNENTFLECSDIGIKATNGYFSNCTILHSYTDYTCLCGPKEVSPVTCPLCGDNKIIPEPNRFVAGKTCQQWQDYVSTQTFEMDCPIYQKSIGAYCGCDISNENFFTQNGDFCRLCKDRIIPDFSKKVTYVDGSQKYCVNVEVDVNVFSYNYDCASQQDKYNKACGCNAGLEELPTLNPTKDLSGGSSLKSNHDVSLMSYMVRILPIVATMFIHYY